MNNAYSADLRERVLAAARETTMTQAEIAKTFSISLSSVEEWLHIYRTTGRTHPLPFAGGAKRVLEPYAQIIREIVATQPDATLAEVCACVAAQTGVSATPSMMCRELRLLNLPLKKNVVRQPTRNRARPNPARGTSRQNRNPLTFQRRTRKIPR